MSVSRRIVTGASATLLATSGFLAASLGVGATSAVAAPGHHTHHCPSKSGKYPPGKCKIFFKHHKVKHHHKVKAKSGRVFKPGEKVTVVFSCPRTVTHKHGHKVVHHHIKRHEPSRVAGQQGGVKSTFKTPKKAHGNCTVEMKGHKSGVVLVGHVHVK